MRIRQLFSRETNEAMIATPRRQLLVFGVSVALIVVAVLLLDLVPWWVFAVAGALSYIGLQVLGSYWAEKDLLRRMEDTPDDR